MDNGEMTMWYVGLKKTENPTGSENDPEFFLFLRSLKDANIQAKFHFKLNQFGLSNEPVEKIFKFKSEHGSPNLVTLGRCNRFGVKDLTIILVMEITNKSKAKKVQNVKKLSRDCSHEKRFQNLLRSGDISDLTILCQDGKSFTCHQFILGRV